MKRIFCRYYYRFVQFLVFAICLISLSSSGEYEDIASSMPAGSDIIVIPLKNAGRLFMVEAVIDNEAGNLIFDTGASNLVLNRTYFRKHVKSGAPESKGITGEVGNVEEINIANMNVSGLTFRNIRASVADLGHIENRRNVKVLGLFGFGMIKEYEIVLDAAKNQLSLFRLDNKGNRKQPANEMKFDHLQKIDFNKNVLFLTGSVNGKMLKFCLDTGAETNAISNHAPKSVLSTVSIERKASLRGSGTAITEVYFGVMKEVKFGDYSVKNMETIITSLESLSEVYGVTIDGMLGYNFISRGIFTFNFVKRETGIQFTKTIATE